MSDQGFRARAASYLAAADAADDFEARRRLFNQAVYWHTLAIQAEALTCSGAAALARGGQNVAPASRHQSHA